EVGGTDAGRALREVDQADDEDGGDGKADDDADADGPNRGRRGWFDTRHSGHVDRRPAVDQSVSVSTMADTNCSTDSGPPNIQIPSGRRWTLPSWTKGRPSQMALPSRAAMASSSAAFV